VGRAVLISPIYEGGGAMRNDLSAGGGAPASEKLASNGALSHLGEAGRLSADLACAPKLMGIRFTFHLPRIAPCWSNASSMVVGAGRAAWGSR